MHITRIKCKVTHIPQQEVYDTYKRDSQSNISITPVTPQAGKLNVKPMVFPTSIPLHCTACLISYGHKSRNKTTAWNSPQSNQNEGNPFIKLRRPVSDDVWFLRDHTKVFLDINKKIMHQWKCRLRNIVLRVSIYGIVIDEGKWTLLRKRADLSGIADGSPTKLSV